MQYSNNGKGIMTPMKYTPWLIVPVKKAWFYETLFFEVVFVMVKDKKNTV